MVRFDLRTLFWGIAFLAVWLAMLRQLGYVPPRGFRCSVLMAISGDELDSSRALLHQTLQQQLAAQRSKPVSINGTNGEARIEPIGGDLFYTAIVQTPDADLAKQTLLEFQRQCNTTKKDPSLYVSPSIATEDLNQAARGETWFRCLGITVIWFG
ncbi:MAG: hypothetical protein KDA42_06685 [Planctomycetales bacterium]|nr:hypothetical protein [Planctomycetales bacterium]